MTTNKHLVATLDAPDAVNSVNEAFKQAEVLLDAKTTVTISRLIEQDEYNPGCVGVRAMAVIRYPNGYSDAKGQCSSETTVVSSGLWGIAHDDDPA